MTFFKFTAVIIQFIVCVLAKPSFLLFIRLKTQGLENLKPLDRKVVFAFNHTHELDPVLARVGLPIFSKFTPMFYVSRPRDYHLSNPNIAFWKRALYGGTFFKLMGSFPAYKGSCSYEVSLRNHIDILNRKGSLCIFPEGRMVKDGSFVRARGGVAFLSHKTNTPVVPVFLNGHTFMTLKDMILRKRCVTFIVGEPLYPKDLFKKAEPDVDDFQEAAEKILKNIRSLAPQGVKN